MRDYNLVLGGLDTGYMKKLTLYIQNRLKHRVHVEIVGDPQQKITEDDPERTLWIGSQEFFDLQRDRIPQEKRLILWEEAVEDETHLCRYQPVEKLYQGIFQRFRKSGIKTKVLDTDREQDWITFLADTSASDLLAFSLTCAGILGRTYRVLYVCFSECCGMQKLLETEQVQLPDLSDLILALRRGSENFCLEGFLGQIEEVHYLLPPVNPMIQWEFTQSDMEQFFSMLRREKQYEIVIFAVGNAFCSCDRLLASSSRVLQLTHGDFSHVCGGTEWAQFARQCIEEENRLETIRIPSIQEDSCGAHCMSSWMEGWMGETARKYMKKEKGLEDEAGDVAGDPGLSV